MSTLQEQLRAWLDPVIEAARFRLTYRLVPRPEGAVDVPELIVDFSGPDSGLLLANDGELLHALEYLAFETLHLDVERERRVMFDCQNRRQLRGHELRTLAGMAAERVLKTGIPYRFGPMSSRDRRILHMALAGRPGVRSESEGVGRDRHLVVHPQTPAAAPATGRRREYRRL